MGCLQSSAADHAYYSPRGEVIHYTPPPKHSAKKEFSFVQGHDAKRFQPNEECYLLCASWHDKWLEFVLNRTKVPPGEIANRTLLDGEAFRHNVKPKKDFRPINREVWEFFFQIYGGGPVIVFRVPSGFTEEEYLKGTWQRKLAFHQLVAIIHPCANPKQMNIEDGITKNPMAEDTASSVALDMLSKQKLEKAKEVQKEINQTNAEAAAMLMNKDRGKNMIKQGNQLEKEATAAQAESIGHMFSENTAAKQLQEAKLAKEKAEESQKHETAAIFAAGNLKAQFRAALKVKNAKLMRELAAKMLQNAWKGKQARKRVKQMQLEREHKLQEGYARKLQSRYRAYLARKKVRRLREEKQRLKEEGSAIMLQSAWRIKQARAKVVRLKAEKQRLMEEFAALKVQSAWRRRQARKRVGKLRGEKKAAEEKRKKSAINVAKALRAAKAKNMFVSLVKESRLVLRVRLQRANDVLVADVNSSDPYVFVHIDQPPLNGVVDLKSRVASTAPSDGGHTWSQYRSKVQYNTLNPVWDEDCLVVLNGSKEFLPELCKLAFTVMDKDNFSSDDFLGQATVPLESLGMAMYSGRTVSLDKLPIGPLAVPLRDAKGKRVALQNTEHQGKGFLYASCVLAKYWKTYHGWMQRLSSHKMGMGFTAPQFKPRFLMLVDGKLMYFDDELSLDHPRGALDLSHVSSFTYLRDKSGEAALHLKAAEEEWTLKFMDNEERDVQIIWLRRLQYNIRSKLNAQSRQLDEIIRDIPQVVDSINKEVSTTPKKATRRVSSFFGTA